MKAPLYKLAPVTASTADFLAGVYGASSIENFAQSLPLSAHILDVGAGNSELGRVVAELRPDISWTNMDINYTPDELHRFNQEAPSNLKYRHGDILNTKELHGSSYDKIFAFWVLPHLGLEDPALIEQAIVNMLGMLKNSRTSRLIVGPLMGRRTGQVPNNYMTAELSKKASEDTLAETVRDCTAPMDKVAELRAMNRSGLTTMKNRQRTGQEPTKLGLWDFKSRRYVKALSIRGFLLLVRFNIYLVIEKIKVARG